MREKSNPIMVIIYSLYTVVLTILTMALCIFFIIICWWFLLLPKYKRYRLFDRIVVMPWTFIFNRLFLLMRIKVIGRKYVDVKRTAVYICNHQSWADIPVTNRYTNSITLSKKDVLNIPFLGLVIRLAGPVTVERENTSSRLNTVKEIISVLKKGHSLTLFPEGTRSVNGKLTTPNTALIKLCFKLNVPVVSCSIEGTYDILPKNRFYVKCFRKVILKYNSPLYPKDFTDEENFSAACWDKVIASHNEILKEYFPEKLDN